MDERIEQSYVIISPVKDEAKYIETTIKAVIRQTVKPLQWIIVDDGSRDETGEIVRRYSERLPWITMLSVPRNGERQGGAPVVRAFMAGWNLLGKTPFDFVVKLDCDLDLPDDYFEKLIAKFREDDRLGITSGIYLEKNNRGWVPKSLPDYHAPGASKMLRTECYKQIGGFILQPGWDTVDEIRARALGWKTCHFKDLVFYHLKPEGSASGYLRTHLRYGETDYLTGNAWPFFLLKAFHRMIVGKPLFLGGLGFMAGFLKAFLLRKPKLVSAHEAKLYRQLLDQRVLERLQSLGRNLRRKVWCDN